MNGSLYLAWRYLAYHRFKTAVLVLSIALIVYVPVGLRVLVAQSAEQLTARAAATPLLLGARGSPLELVLSSLYFESETPAPIPFAETARVTDSDLAVAIPLYVRFAAGGHRIVGTTLDYFGFRRLRVADGRSLALLGECVLGATAAEALGKAPGDTLVSSPETVFDIAGVYPLELRVVGVLAPAHTPDDRAVFVDIKTAWIIEGLGHGHDDLASPDANAGVLSRDGDRIVANASVPMFRTITAANVDSFHFHGDAAQWPLTAVIAVPPDDRSAALLRGRYLGDREPMQILRPVDVVDELLGTILTVQTYVVAAVVFVGLATLSTTILVFVLSLRLRRREIETMIKIGGARSSVASVLALEVAFVLASAAAVAAGLTLLTARYGSEWIRSAILG